MKTWTVMAVAILLALPLLAAAQDDAAEDGEPTLLERIQRTAELIEACKEAREVGIPDDEVAEVLNDARERGLSPAETEAVLAESTAAVEEFGPVDNLGAFVRTKLDEGLRGRELAEAIHAEHRAHGKGKGYGKGEGHDKHQKKEKHDGHRNDHPGDHDEGKPDTGVAHPDDHDHDDGDQDQEGHGKGGKKGKGKK